MESIQRRATQIHLQEEKMKGVVELLMIKIIIGICLSHWLVALMSLGGGGIEHSEPDE